ncbi:MAG: ABC transporter ATP-binding protein [Bacteroidales bacterium]|nr:ABC transporter ATP-binding protein [Bacteroidales bacterium]
MNTISVNQLSKSYGQTKALKEISLEVKEGEIFGLIGPDGAGKTTLFRILVTLLLPDSGTANLNGFDCVNDYKKIRRSVGYMPGRFSLYPDLSVEENLEFFATIFNTSISENYSLIRDIYTQIEPFKKRPAGKLSGGMKQKLALCCALIHRPEVLLLDEPTTGVDAVSRKEFWEMLRRINKQGITILVSTPYMDEAVLCDRIALMQNGEILGIETPENLIGQFNHRLLAVKSDETFRLISDLEECEYINTVYPFGDYLHVTPQTKDCDLSELKTYLEQKKHQHLEIKEIKPNIEDCFMDLMVGKTQKNK